MGHQDTRAQAQSSSRTAPAVGSADASNAAVHPRTVFVPRRPGLLREYQPRSPRPRDELDDLIDELLGPTTDEKPGRFDAGLVVVGLGLAAWSIMLGGPSVALWVGIAAIVLGLVLPARALLRRFDSSPPGGLQRRVVDRGLPLDASQPDTLALIDAYTRLLQTSCTEGARDPKQTVLAGHAAVVEVARRLGGQPPDTPTAAWFVSMRTDALEAMTRRMLRAHDPRPVQAAIQTHGGTAQPRSTPQPFPIERRWMPPRTQARSPNPGSPPTSSGRRS